MENYWIIIANATVTIIGGLWIKSFLPSYMSQKGKNLATKEDIGEITSIVKDIENSFNKELEQFRSDIDFRKTINITLKEAEKDAISNFHGQINEWIYRIFNVDLSEMRKLKPDEINSVAKDLDYYHQSSLLLSKVRLTVINEDIIQKSRDLLTSTIEYKGKVEWLLQQLAHEKKLIEINIRRQDFPPILGERHLLQPFQPELENKIEKINNKIDNMINTYLNKNKLEYFKVVQAKDDQYVDAVKKYLTSNSSD